MKKLRELPYELADKLELPEDVLLGSAKLTVTGGRSAVIENHRGVLEYNAERIVVAVPRGKVCLDGTGLRLKAMNKNELLVGGRIRNIEWG
ncbi:MAG: YabP/YqfC family sporulation protein [Candidatus Limivicinus sp.]|nr:YabP/YqfC family sporulation protein [Candidatus Limivicinus sp.]